VGRQRVGTGRPSQHGEGAAYHLGSDQHRENVVPCERHEKHHAETDALNVIQQSQPQPKAAGQDGRTDRASRPREIPADTASSPEFLGPARRAKTDGKDGKKPGVRVGEVRESVENNTPEANKEAKGQEEDAPARDPLGREEETPATAIRCRKPVVLNDDHDEEPGDDLATVERDPEAGDLGRRLAVEIRQSHIENSANGPHEDGNRNANDDCLGDGGAGQEDCGRRIRIGNQGAPVPQGETVYLRKACHDKSSSDPLLCGSTTWERQLAK